MQQNGSTLLPSRGAGTLADFKSVSVTIPVPWGTIAAKAWGNPINAPVLALHGWQDNAGGFDNLIPLLSKEMYIVAMDWPGHGLSSKRPYHYNTFDYVSDIRYVADSLKWKSFSLLAHSMGAGAASWFAAALPEQVKGMVLLDGIGFHSAEITDIPRQMGRALLALNQDTEVKSKVHPTWEAIVARVLEGHAPLDDNFDVSCAAVLAVRGAKAVEGGYEFTRDPKLKMPSLLRIPHELNIAFLQQIRCQTLVVLPTHGKWYELMRKTISSVNNTKIHTAEVPGGHFVHMYNPGTVSQLINDFMLSKNTEM
eukprot:Em0020g668a